MAASYFPAAGPLEEVASPFRRRPISAAAHIKQPPCRSSHRFSDSKVDVQCPLNRKDGGIIPQLGPFFLTWRITHSSLWPLHLGGRMRSRIARQATAADAGACLPSTAASGGSGICYKHASCHIPGHQFMQACQTVSTVSPDSAPLPWSLPLSVPLDLGAQLQVLLLSFPPHRH